LRKIQKEKTMITENQDIILYAPKSNVFTAVILGVMALSIGSAFLFSARWQFPFLLGGLFFVIAGLWFGLVITWQILHDPILIINSEGILSQTSFLIKWEEIDSIYSVHARSRDAFALDASPAGLLSFFSRRGVRIPRQMDRTIPQQALVISSTNLPLPVNQILTLIRERFSAQLEQYHIVLDDGHTEGENS
jgi:hypothetical protein